MEEGVAASSLVWRRRQVRGDGDEGEEIYNFHGIEDHKQIENLWNVLVLWEDRKQTWESLNVIIKDGPITVSQYAV